MRDVAAGRCTGAEFAVGWLDARRRSQQQGERVRDPLETLLDRVFSLLEDYSIDPQFKEPEDLSDDELKNAVIELLRRHTVSQISARARISSIGAAAFTHRRD
ncbi:MULTISPECIES: colicin immunity domain-containing protein [Streptomyces]|uniref:colicin immunity domain-containing protein n=1 Tax=Streptomyces TaxID=1883 RepID=UPI001F4DCDE5|nr:MULTISPECIES: colicin immunity domain-containing protein [Streptomyces]WSS35641.1 colicin immunity domain-containing protein [Streptomyces microflavus]